MYTYHRLTCARSRRAPREVNVQIARDVCEIRHARAPRGAIGTRVMELGDRANQSYRHGGGGTGPDPASLLSVPPSCEVNRHCY